MKKFLLISLCVFSFHFLYSNNPIASNSIIFEEDNSININKENTPLNLNYQQFKHQVVNFESNNAIDYGYLKKRRSSKDDNLMLYVAGGLAVATTTLILTNDPENFTTNSAGSVNMGIAIGGTVGCALFVTKYFIDKSR